MNSTALKAAYTSLNFRCRLHSALVKTARLKHSTAHVPNRKGDSILAVRWDRVKGFTITDKKGNNVTKPVFNLLRD